MWTVILFTLALITWLLLTRKRYHPPLPPGPSGLPIVGNLLSLDPELHSYFADLARSHGPIVGLRLGTKLGVIISSPALSKEVLRDNDVTFANRDVPAAGRAATYGGSDIAWNPYGPEWRLLRKVCVKDMLGVGTLDAVYNLRRREVRRAINLMSVRAGSPVNVGEEMFLVVMKVVTGMLWGGTVAEAEEREQLGREFRKAVAEMTALLGMPNLSDFFPALAKLDLQGVENRMRKVATKFDGIFEKVIDRRLKMEGDDVGKKREKDFLQVLLQMKDDYERDDGNNNEAPFTMIHLKALLMDMVVAGTDTTSNTVEFAMAEILNKPNVLKKVQQELDTVVGRDNIVEEHHIYKLPYLQAVMKETLRLHPVLPLLIPHCPSESCIVGGYTIPKGSRVFINVWAIHRDPSIWANPTEFDPQRFLNSKFDHTGNDFSYLPFGSGRRICAGIGMAERMVLYSLASFLHSFDWKSPKGEGLDLEEKFGIVMSKRKPLVVIPERRLSDPALKNKVKPPLPPGLRGLPIVGYLPFLGSDLHKTFKDLASTYGPIFKVRLGMKTCIVVTSPSLVKEVLRDKDVIFANRDPNAAASIIAYGPQDITFSDYSPEWRKMRNIVASELMSNAILDANYSIRKQEMKTLIKETYNKAGELVDVGELVFAYIISFVMVMLWGGTLQVQGNEGAEFRALTAEFMQLLGVANISDYIPLLARFDLQGIRRRTNSVYSQYNKMFDSAIKKHDSEKCCKQKDFLGHLLQLTKHEDPATSLTLPRVKDILTDTLFGGIDTTSTTVEWAMAELLQHPKVMRKAQEEITEIVGLNNTIEEAHLPKLKYLEAIVKETLRLHPPIALLVPHRPSKSTTIGGYTVPKGCQIILNAWAIHRDPQLWEAATAFQPERFLDGSSGEKLDCFGNNPQYIPFGTGRRMCPGITLADKRSMHVLAALLHSFDWTLTDGTREVDLSVKYGIVAKKAKPLMAVPSPRLSSLELYSEEN